MGALQTVKDNPNAAVGAGGGVGVVGIVWFAGNVWPKVQLSAEAGAAIATSASTVLVFLGRNGLSGLWRIIRYGSSTPRPPTVG